MSEEKEKLYCSFCAKADDEVQKLVAGPVAHICDQCIILAAECIEAPKEPATDWVKLSQRLTKFCEIHNLPDTLGTLGEIIWVIGLDFDFKLTPRPRK